MFNEVLIQTCEKYISHTLQELYDALSNDERIQIHGHSYIKGAWSFSTNNDLTLVGEDIILDVFLNDGHIYIYSTPPKNNVT